MREDFDWLLVRWSPGFVDFFVEVSLEMFLALGHELTFDLLAGQKKARAVLKRTVDRWAEVRVNLEPQLGCYCRSRKPVAIGTFKVDLL